MSGTAQACAYGSAVLGAVAGEEYSSLTEAAKSIKKISSVSYKPNPANAELYNILFKEFETLSEFFANSENKTMNVLKKLS